MRGFLEGVKKTSGEGNLVWNKLKRNVLSEGILDSDLAFIVKVKNIDHSGLDLLLLII